MGELSSDPRGEEEGLSKESHRARAEASASAFAGVSSFAALSTFAKLSTFVSSTLRGLSSFSTTSGAKLTENLPLVWVEGLGFRVCSVRFRVCSVGYTVWGAGCV